MNAVHCAFPILFEAGVASAFVHQCESGETEQSERSTLQDVQGVLQKIHQLLEVGLGRVEHL